MRAIAKAITKCVVKTKMQLAVFNKHPGDKSTETQQPWGWDGMSLATMRSPVAEDEHIPHEIEDQGVRKAWAAAFVASAKADSANARCAVRSDCFVATSTGTMTPSSTLARISARRAASQGSP